MELVLTGAALLYGGLRIGLAFPLSDSDPHKSDKPEDNTQIKNLSKFWDGCNLSATKMSQSHGALTPIRTVLVGAPRILRVINKSPLIVGSSGNLTNTAVNQGKSRTFTACSTARS